MTVTFNAKRGDVDYQIELVDKQNVLRKDANGNVYEAYVSQFFATRKGHVMREDLGESVTDGAIADMAVRAAEDVAYLESCGFTEIDL